jgi:hypothetical protein
MGRQSDQVTALKRGRNVARNCLTYHLPGIFPLLGNPTQRFHHIQMADDRPTDRWGGLRQDALAHPARDHA